jgi:hypothetical protein
LTPEEEVVKAGQANEILENEIFKEAVKEIFDALRDARINSPVKDVALREKLWAQEVALESILAKLRLVIETGMMAEKSLLEKAKDALGWN